jgi:hypothetical protein
LVNIPDVRIKDGLEQITQAESLIALAYAATEFGMFRGDLATESDGNLSGSDWHAIGITV